jgi:hypothetical protein
VTIWNPSKLRGSGLLESSKCGLQRLVPEGCDHGVYRVYAGGNESKLLYSDAGSVQYNVEST